MNCKPKRNRNNDDRHDNRNDLRFQLAKQFRVATSVFAEAEEGFFGVKLGGTAARPAAYAASIASCSAFNARADSSPG